MRKQKRDDGETSPVLNVANRESHRTITSCVRGSLRAEERRMLAIQIVTAVALVAGAGRHFLRSTMNDIDDDY
jgi:hypothetical protein